MSVESDDSVENDFDCKVSDIIQHYRRVRGLSPEQLGQELDATFQQIQLYEGTDIFCNAKNMSVSCDEKMPDYLLNVKLIRGFMRIQNPKIKRMIQEIICNAVEGSDA